jgi:hypothetical protein
MGPAFCLKADKYLTKFVLLLENKETETFKSHVNYLCQYLIPTSDKRPTFYNMKSHEWIYFISSTQWSLWFLCLNYCHIYWKGYYGRVINIFSIVLSEVFCTKLFCEILSTLHANNWKMSSCSSFVIMTSG